MDLQELMDNAVQASRSEQFKGTDQITLGELTVLIENVDPALPVVFDDGKMCPVTVGSWRGSYRELAIRYEETEDTEPMIAAEFLNLLEEADGKEFRGWKGGMFQMGQTTPVWVANRGESYGFEHDWQGVVGVEEDNGVVVVVTDETPYA